MKRRAELGARERFPLSGPTYALVVVCALFFLTGCDGNQQPFAISLQLLLTVLVALKNEKHLRFATGEKLDPGEAEKSEDELRDDRHKAWFIFRRTELIGKRHDDWDETELIPRVRAQFDRITTYLNAKIGAGGTLAGYAEPGGVSTAPNTDAFTSSPAHHFDLQNVAIAVVGGASDGGENEYLRFRHATVRAIVWHAAGSHDEVWSEGGDGAVLNELSLNELLDRRLVTIERMRYQINGFQAHPPENTSGQLGRGPWFDGSRVRVFEYPHMPKAFVLPEQIFNPGDQRNINHIWVPFDAERVRYVWTGDLGQQTRFLPEPVARSADWQAFSEATYVRTPGATNLSTSLPDLFQSRTDLWHRAWLFCDHSISALHLESLRFALQRRGSTVNLDALLREKHVYLAGIVGGVVFEDDGPRVQDDDSLWQDGVRAVGDNNDPGVFDNAFIKFREAQPGDHVILWNHHLYVFVTFGVWRLENAVITEVDVRTDNWDNEEKVDPAIFMTPNRDNFHLDGFGAGHKYSDFQAALFESIGQGLAAIYPQLATTATAFVIANTESRGLAIRWSPYPTGIHPPPDDPNAAPWWVFLSRVAPNDKFSPYPTLEKMLEVIPQTVIDGSGRGSDYVSPPESILLPGDPQPKNLTDGVFFPLYTPVVGGREKSWQDYFEARSANPSLQAVLRRTELTADFVPGLFVRGQTQPFEIIRPRANPRTSS